MIGVITRNNEADVVAEFFQLFKTPWEFHRSGKSYDVVISSTADIEDIDANLIVVYSSRAGRLDAEYSLSLAPRPKGALLVCDDKRVPIYGDLSTLLGKFQPLLTTDMDSEAAAGRIVCSQRKILRIGYDLFEEAAFLLSKGQPPKNAMIPTLDLHISMLRKWIVQAGVPLVEIPPTPADHDFLVCLTHDVDFVSIRHHKFDHTIAGFAYRSTIGSIVNLLRKRISWSHCVQNWKAFLSLPFVYLGGARDFWVQFEEYLKIEKGLPSTYFFIPFKGRSGENINGRYAKRRAGRYDLADVSKWIKILSSKGCEIAVHGIDAWHSSERGREELERLAQAIDKSEMGIRMHWLCFDDSSFQKLEDAGFVYDSTLGYNDAVGYRAGTAQVFRPLGARNLLELPLIVHDTAMFYPNQMHLLEAQAWERCQNLMRNSNSYGGALTILWHQRSLAPERLWGDFYLKLLDDIKRQSVAFGTARQVVDWFRKRRSLSFKHVSFMENMCHLELDVAADETVSNWGFNLRIYKPSSDGDSRSDAISYMDVPWNRQRHVDISLA